eukprot:362265_1
MAALRGAGNIPTNSRVNMTTNQRFVTLLTEVCTINITLGPSKRLPTLITNGLQSLADVCSRKSWRLNKSVFLLYVNDDKNKIKGLASAINKYLGKLVGRLDMNPHTLIRAEATGFIAWFLRAKAYHSAAKVGKKKDANDINIVTQKKPKQSKKKSKKKKKKKKKK